MRISIISVAKDKFSLQTNLSLVVTVLIVVLSSAASCGSSFHSTRIDSKTEATPPPLIKVDSLCERIGDIKILPQKDNPVDDPAYNALLDAGEKAIPCLIRKITDTTVMTDPRQAPKVTGVRVGDVAYFMFVRLGKLDFVEFLPPDVRTKYARDGVYGYFEHIDERNNRQKLQEAAYKWYEQKYGRNLRKE
jgi:hypothetical protein